MARQKPQSRRKPPDVQGLFFAFLTKDWGANEDTRALAHKSFAALAFLQQVFAGPVTHDSMYSMSKVWTSVGEPAGADPKAFLDAHGVQDEHERSEVRADGSVWSGYETTAWYCEFVDPANVTPGDICTLLY